MIIKATKSFVFLLGAHLLSGCVELGPIRDYAKSSAQLSGGQEIVSRWVDSDKILIEKTKPAQLAVVPSSMVRGRRNGDVQKRVENIAADIMQIHKALESYFDAVAILAADDLPNISTQTGKLSTAIGTLVPSFGDPEKDAFSAVINLLSLPLDAYRQKKLRDLISSQSENINKLLFILSQCSIAIQSDIAAEASTITDKYSPLIGKIPSKNIADIYQIRKDIWLAEMEYSDIYLALDRYRSALESVRRNHELIASALESDGAKFRTFSRYLVDARAELIDAREAVRLAVKP